jgi:glycosyltransferase involved in cell wall biosynthesis
MTTLWLSVIMPTYNGAAFVETALRSLVAQEERDFEVIVIDDGSTDDTVSLVKAFAKELPITLIEREHLGNWVANTNLAISYARGRYIGWLHQDDTWHPDRLAQLRPLTSEWPHASLVLHPCWYIDTAGRRLGPKRCSLPQKLGCLDPAEVIPRLLVQNTVAASAPLCLAESVHAVGGLDEGLWYTADWDLWLKLAKLGPTVYCPGRLATFRLHSGSLSLKGPSRLADIRRQFAVVLKRHAQPWARDTSQGKMVRRASRLSVDVNLALMQLKAGGRIHWWRLLRKLLRLGPIGCYRFFHDTRLFERCAVRIRAGLATAARRN